MAKLLDIPSAEYHRISAASASQLWDLYNQCPAYAYAQDYAEPSEAMIRGTYVDRELFHGDGDKHVSVRPDGINGRSKEGKAELARLRVEAEESGRYWLEKKPDWMAVVTGMVKAARKHADIGPLLDPDCGLTHPVIVWTDKATGEKCKAELDKIVPYNGYAAVFDLKTVASAHPRAFDAKQRTLGYFFKMSWYEYALQQLEPGADRPLLLGVVEQQPPHLCALYELDIGYHEAGKRQIREALDRYAECRKTGNWPGYPSQTLEAPEWLK